MRTSRKAIMLLMVGAMLIAATAGAFAQGFGGMRSWGSRGYRIPAPSAVPGKGPAVPPMAYRGMMKAYGLGTCPYYYKFEALSAADKDKVVKILQDTQAKILPLQNEVRAERLTLNTLLRSANPDKAKIDASINKIADLQKQIQQIRADSILEINKIFEGNTSNNSTESQHE
jgi:uncharacterized membrane protein